VGTSSNRPRSAPDVFAPDTRPGADEFVYCKGCGQPLESRARLSKPKVVVDTMMCEACREVHGHALMPSPGSPTHCYRCGGLEEIFEGPGISPVIYHVCPRCLPERVARYRKGDFETPMRTPGAESSEEA
jgi:hypothetical protein